MGDYPNNTERQVGVAEVRFNEEGEPIGTGGVFAIGVSKAREGVEKGTHRACGYPAGFVPEHWGEHFDVDEEVVKETEENEEAAEE